jgi:GT2 family glycosyltransferase
VSSKETPIEILRGPETGPDGSNRTRGSLSDRWEVIQVRLDQPLHPVRRPENAAGVYLVFWWKNIPLGEAKIFREEFPLNNADLHRRISKAIAPAVGNYLLEDGFKAALPTLPLARQHPSLHRPPTLESLVALRRPLENLANKVPCVGGSISVLVCTRGRPEHLRRCLTALQRLTPAPVEIVVVDNQPEDRSTFEVVKAFAGVVYCPEPIVGLSRARNRGIWRSSGEIVAFTDDDAVVHPGWLLGVRQALSQEGVFGMSGLVLAEKLETESQIRFEFDFGGFNGGYRPIIFDSFFFKSTLKKGVPVWRIGAGVNMAFRREVFSRIGVFDERLGAGAAGCSEDSEFWYRMLAAGMTVRYEPRAVVWHTHRAGREAFQNQMHQYMRGHVAALLVQFEKHGHVGNIRRLFITLPYYCRQRLKRMSHKGDWTLLRGEMHGYASGFGAYIRGFFRGNRRIRSKTRCATFAAR